MKGIYDGELSLHKAVGRAEGAGSRSVSWNICRTTRNSRTTWNRALQKLLPLRPPLELCWPASGALHSLFSSLWILPSWTMDTQTSNSETRVRSWSCPYTHYLLTTKRLENKHWNLLLEKAHPCCPAQQPGTTDKRPLPQHSLQISCKGILSGTFMSSPDP